MGRGRSRCTGGWPSGGGCSLDGLVYIDSWVALPARERCFQLMETDEPALFDEWIAGWQDLVEFEVVAVVRSADPRPRDR